MNSLKINTFHMKLIALVFMVIDHIAFTLIPTNTAIYLVMRCLGRIAAPLFWFSFVEGYKHTSNKKRYFLRLLMAGICMGAVNVAFKVLYGINITFLNPNMFITLSAIILLLELYKSYQRTDGSSTMIFKTVALLTLSYLISQYLEYGPFVVIIAPILYFVENRWMKTWLHCVASFCICLYLGNIPQMTMIVSGFLFLCYSNQKPTKSWKWFFYIFYPLHFWILLTIRLIFF